MIRKIVISIVVFVLVFSELNIFVAESIVGDSTEPEIECEEQLESEGEENLTTECKEQLESENGEDPITEGKEQPETENGEAPTTEGKEHPELENGENPTTEGEGQPESENGEDPTTEGEKEQESENSETPSKEENPANACETWPESETEGEEQLESNSEKNLAIDCEEEEEPETENLEVDCEDEYYIEGEELVAKEEEQLEPNGEEALVTEGEEQSESKEKTELKCPRATPRGPAYPGANPIHITSSLGTINDIERDYLSQLNEKNELDGFIEMDRNLGLEFKEESGRKHYMYFGDLYNGRPVNSLDNILWSYEQYQDDWGKPLPDPNTLLYDLVKSYDYIQAKDFTIATALAQDGNKENGIVTHFHKDGRPGRTGKNHIPDKAGNGFTVGHGADQDGGYAHFITWDMPLLKLYKNEQKNELIAYAAVIDTERKYIEGYVKFKMSLKSKKEGRINVSMKYLKLRHTYHGVNFAYSVHLDVGGRHDKKTSKIYSLGDDKGFYLHEKNMGDGQDYLFYVFREGYANHPVAFKPTSRAVQIPFNLGTTLPGYKYYFGTLNGRGMDGIKEEYKPPKGGSYFPIPGHLDTYDPDLGWAVRWNTGRLDGGQIREENIEFAVANRPMDKPSPPVIKLDNDGEYTKDGYRITGTFKDEDSDYVNLHYMVISGNHQGDIGKYANPNPDTDVPWDFTIPSEQVEKGLDHEIIVYAADDDSQMSNIEVIKVRPTLTITEQVFGENGEASTEVAPGETLKYEILVDSGYIAKDTGTYDQLTITQKYDPHLESPTDLKVIDENGKNIGEVIYNNDGIVATLDTNPKLLRSKKVKVTFNAKVKDKAEGEIVAEAIATGTYSTGDVVNKKSDEVKTKITGVLKFVSAPEVIGFGEKLTITPRTKTYHLSQFDERLAVKDSRALSRNPSWKMTAQLVKPLTGKENRDSVLNGLYYLYGGKVSTLTEDDSALVYEKKTTNKEEINISNTWTPEGDGLYLEVPAGTAKVGGYEGTIQWTLQNVPPNEE